VALCLKDRVERSLIMGLIRFVFGTVLSIIAFAISVKLIAILVGVVGFVLKLVLMAVIIGVFLLIAWIVYKIIAPRRAEQI
jgi:hypothetical protein